VKIGEAALHIAVGIGGLAIAAVMLRKHIRSEERRNAAFLQGIAEIHLLPRFVVFEDPRTSNSYPVAGNA
jgi:hypothetical protein